jgi:Glycosyltransferase
MGKIKVLNIISDTNIGGAGKCILTIGKHYDRDKFDLIVAVPKGSALKEELEKIGVACVEADAIADESISFAGISAQKKLIRSIKPDVVHTHATLSARIAARLAGSCGIVYTRHCVYEPSRFMKSLIGKCINKSVAALFSDKIIAVAEAAAENLTDVGVPKSKIEVILNGISPLSPLSEEEKEKQRKRFGVEEGQKVVSIIARLEEVKGHKYFIEAAQILESRGIHAKFIAAGKGTYEETLFEEAKNSATDVLFPGFIEDPQNLVGITDVSVNASFGTEATSISLLEGMSLGIPAVVSRYGGNPGVIIDGENGILFPVHGSKAMADGIEKLLTDEKLYQKMSKRAKEIFYNTFTAEQMTKRTEEIYVALSQKRHIGI